MKPELHTIFRAGVPGARGREWSELRMILEVQVSDAATPNRLQAKIYNLSDDSVAFLQSDDIVAQLLAGAETPLLLGTGEVTRVESTWQGPDRITTIECADGRKSLTSQVNISESGEVSARGLIEKVGERMGFEVENLNIDDLKLPRGFTAAGRGGDILKDLTRSVGADFHVERGGLVVLPRGAPTERKAVLLRADSGLIGTPQRTKEGIKATCLLNPKIRSRGIVRIESREVVGFYMVRSYKHIADKFSDAWHTEIEATRIDE